MHVLVLAALVLSAPKIWKDHDDRSALTSRVQTGDVNVDLPAFFNATLFADLGNNARHIVVRDDGVVYVRLDQRGAPSQGYIVALRDTNGDGVADQERRFGRVPGTGITLHNGYLYYSSSDEVFRRKFTGSELEPAGREQRIAKLPTQRSHAAKPVTIDEAGNLYVTVGAPSNACMKQARTKGSAGLRPCPQLEEHGAIWRFDANRTGQPFAAAKKHAGGLRQVVALEWNPSARALFAVQHGRDQLNEFFPAIYSTLDSAELPAEEFLRLDPGFVGGWPYTYYDWRVGKRMVAPEYGGNGKTPAEPGEYPEPEWAFPGHYGPNDLVFYTGNAFPKRYDGAAFIAFHGSWNRSPHGQRGYHVAVVPFSEGKAGRPFVFMDGFAGKTRLGSSRDALHRPTGLAVGPKGSLYVTDSRQGYVWKIDYVGE
ncbi:MAG: sorbosone dehydrogenase [Myxococcota bacterium]